MNDLKAGTWHSLSRSHLYRRRQDTSFIPQGPRCCCVTSVGGGDRDRVVFRARRRFFKLSTPVWKRNPQACGTARVRSDVGWGRPTMADVWPFSPLDQSPMERTIYQFKVQPSHMQTSETKLWDGLEKRPCEQKRFNGCGCYHNGGTDILSRQVPDLDSSPTVSGRRVKGKDKKKRMHISSHWNARLKPLAQP
ncbi:hypothetical protein VTN02DRAFT_1542 [Thermoascus thermophilus]